MITYCIGNSSVKRKLFRASADDCSAVCLDNDEVLASFSLDGKQYFVVGEIPFGDMQIGQFIAFSRSLKTNLPMKKVGVKIMLKKASLKLSMKKKLKRLNRIDYRAVMLASKADEDTATLYANFDGIKYTRRAAKKLNYYIERWNKSYNLYVAVTDSRFIPKNAETLVYSDGGIVSGFVTAHNKTIPKRVFKKQLEAAGMDLRLPLKNKQIIQVP